ncbi:MAG TPA: adenylate/guanylate cyclase domain-containing protein [Steroidobacteraceae bacterium]|nr:adenylate/guanylate cyclase domain-containing protein [Steroidobacteraceae bacterium]
MAVTTEQFQVLAAGNCAAIRSVLEESPVAQRFRLDSCGIHADIMASIDRVAPDLILLDADDTDLAGLEACRALKDHPATMMLPIVVVSLNSDLQMAAYSAGADDFMTATSRDAVLLARLEALARAGSRRRKIAAAARNTDERRGEQLQATFRRYVSPQLADRILGSSRLRDSILTAADIRTRAVVMFADLRGFTGISERLSPHEVVPLLNEYFSLLTEITFQHEGTVFHMAGDGLMVGFGVPFEQHDSAPRAVRAAQEMLARFALLADTWRTRLNIETGLGIGINEGDVVAGNVGSAMYMNYTIIGDAVNVASRLCQRARAGEMVLSGALKQSLDARGHAINAVELPPMTLRGRSTPIDIYCVPIGKRLRIVEALPATTLSA